MGYDALRLRDICKATQAQYRRQYRTLSAFKRRSGTGWIPTGYESAGWLQACGEMGARFIGRPASDAYTRSACSIDWSMP